MSTDSPILGFVRYYSNNSYIVPRDQFLDWLDTSLRIVIENDPAKALGIEKERSQHRSAFCIYPKNDETRELISNLSKDLSVDDIPDRNTLTAIVEESLLNKKSNLQFNAGIVKLVNHILFNQVQACTSKLPFIQEALDLFKTNLTNHMTETKQPFTAVDFIQALDKRNIQTIKNCFDQATDKQESLGLIMKLHDYLKTGADEENQDFVMQCAELLGQQMHEHYKDSPSEYMPVVEHWEDTEALTQCSTFKLKLAKKFLDSMLGSL